MISFGHLTGRLNRNHPLSTLLYQRKQVQLTNYSPTRWQRRRRLTAPSFFGVNIALIRSSFELPLTFLETPKETTLHVASRLFLYCSRSGKIRLLWFSRFIGPANLLRSQSRLRRLSYVRNDTKHTVLLDDKLLFINLLLINLHQSYHHLGFDYIRAQVGHKYIILKMRTSRYQCIPCRKLDAIIVYHMMSDLPEEKLGYLVY